MLLLACFLAVASAAVDDVDEELQAPAPTYATEWRRRALFTEAGCQPGKEYEYVEDPFNHCELYLPEGESVEHSQIRRNYNAAAGQFEQCIYTDQKCTVAEQCRNVTTGCTKADFGMNRVGYFSTTIGAPDRLVVCAL